KNLIQKFLQRMDGHQQAERSRYIMMNAPKPAVAKIKEIIPSLKSPTVMPLANEDMVAIHTVIPIDESWIVVDELKAEVATGIVSLRIGSMILLMWNVRSEK